MGALAKGLSILGAAIGLLPRVALQVNQEARAAAEGLATLQAHVWLLPCVHNEAWSLTEGLATCATDKWLLPHVYPLVLGQVGALHEGLATLPTPTRLLPGVDSLMYDEGGTLAEGLPIHSTCLEIPARGSQAGVVADLFPQFLTVPASVSWETSFLSLWPAWCLACLSSLACLQAVLNALFPYSPLFMLPVFQRILLSHLFFPESNLPFQLRS